MSSVSTAGGGGGGRERSVSLEAITENALFIRNNIDLPKLLPLLHSKNLLTVDQMSRLGNQAHTVIERTGYLLQFVTTLKQQGIDAFIACLRESRCHGHDQIIALLEDSSSNEPTRSPLLDIFESRRDDILLRLSFTTFNNKMIEMEVISVHENMDIYNPHSSPEENIRALIELLVKRPGAEGLLKFIECLHQDTNPGHSELATILLKEAATLVECHPRRGEIPRGDKTQLLLLERWREVGTPSDIAIKRAFINYETRLCREVNVSTLLPHLLKKNIITTEEEKELLQHREEQRAKRLVAMVREKGMRSIVSFVDCIKQSPGHERLARLFDMTSARRIPAKPTSEKTSKLAVFVCMDTYLELTNDYEAIEKDMSTYNKDFESHRESLHVCLDRLQFIVIDLRPFLIDRLNKEGSTTTSSSNSGKQHILNSIIDKEVATRCNNDATVLMYITGHQFPLKKKVEDDDSEKYSEKYSGAVLIDGSSILSRRDSDCIDMNQLKYWVELLPTDNITFLVDCHHSHVVSYGKQRLPSEVEIMTSPWSALTGSPGVVLFFCQPDTEAMWRLRGTYSDDKSNSVFGKLTELFVKALISWFRRGQKMEISHRLFYESISFHWHKNGRFHKLFQPAIQGDVDRSFLGTSSFPYLQVLRADLIRSTDSTDTASRYDLTKLQVATGTHLGLIKDDELVVFHILHPEVKVDGRIVRAHPLSSVAEVKEEGRDKLSRLLKLIYEEEEDCPDGSTEFVLLKKKFPLHLRDNYAVICKDIPESDTETIKNYIKTTSQLLSYAHNFELARLVVTKRGQFFVVEDREIKKEDKTKMTPAIVMKPRVKTIQNVKSVLEIMAWFKHVKNLRSQTDLNHFLCYLICEKPLLSHTSSPIDDFTIKASTQTEPYEASKAILHFSDNPCFWTPSIQDTAPTLEVEFIQNHVVTAVELRGDPDCNTGHIKKAELSYQKLVFAEDCTAPGPKELKSVTMTTQEKAWFITIKPLEWNGYKEGFTEFCLAIRILASVPSHERGKVRTQGVPSLKVLYWNYLCGVAGWNISPRPIIDKAGHAILDLGRTENMLQWTGRRPHPMTFDLGSEHQIEKIEIACVPGTNPLLNFRIELCNKWLAYDVDPLPSFPSSWPHRQELIRPLVLSHLQLCPIEWEGTAGFKTQIQLYGNTYEKKVVAEERDILQLHFVNHTKQCQFVYVYYLEETGKIEIVLADIVPAKNGLKKLLRVHIPDGYDPVAKKIIDQYRVLVSPKKIYLEPLNQLGLHEYLGVRCYNPCYIGRRTDIGKDEQWNEYKFEVVINKGKSRRHREQ